MNIADSKVFRGGLGICLYLAQDCPHMKTLSGYMGCPTIEAMSALKHLATYLKGAMDHGVMLHICGPGDVLMDYLVQFFQIDIESFNRMRSPFELEVCSDSNWVGCTVTRSRKALLRSWFFSVEIFTASGVALSSREAELLAAVGDAIQISNILIFLVNEEKLENSDRVTLALHTDSSSAKAAWQRSGSGRLNHVDTRMLWLQRMLRKQYIRDLSFLPHLLRAPTPCKIGYKK